MQLKIISTIIFHNQLYDEQIFSEFY